MGEVEISRGGLLAIAGGAVFTMLLGGGLMALVFYSSRKGHDDAVESSEDTLREARRRFAQHKARRNWRRRP